MGLPAPTPVITRKELKSLSVIVSQDLDARPLKHKHPFIQIPTKVTATVLLTYLQELPEAGEIRASEERVRA